MRSRVVIPAAVSLFLLPYPAVTHHAVIKNEVVLCSGLCCCRDKHKTQFFSVDKWCGTLQELRKHIAVARPTHMGAELDLLRECEFNLQQAKPLL